jgi:hypothetical protein
MVVIMASSLLAAIWWYATKEHQFVDRDMHPLFIRGTMFNLLSIPLIFGISIGLSLVDLVIAQYFWLSIIPLNLLIRYKHKH